MNPFIGEFECRLDGKGRIIIPAKLKRQLPPDGQDSLILNRGLEKCLSLFPRTEWAKEMGKLKDLNLYLQDDRRFYRFVNNGSVEVTIDSSDRILIPKKLIEYAEIHSDVVLFAYSNRIEIWSAENYQQELTIDPVEYSLLAERVMGKNKPHRPEGNL